MTPRKKDEDDEDKKDDVFDIFDVFNNPNKIFQSKQFRNLFEEIFGKLMKNMPPEFQGLSPEDIKKELLRNKDKFGLKGPFMYGFNINIGPDGMPKIDSFGNIGPKGAGAGRTEAEVKESREPLVEVNEEKDHITVIAEMPGIEKKDIEIKATSHSLTISSRSNAIGRNYYKDIELPAMIDSNVAKARYQNGILEIQLKKIAEKQTDIKIE